MARLVLHVAIKNFTATRRRLKKKKKIGKQRRSESQIFDVHRVSATQLSVNAHARASLEPRRNCACTVSFDILRKIGEKRVSLFFLLFRDALVARNFIPRCHSLDTAVVFSTKRETSRS